MSLDVVMSAGQGGKAHPLRHFQQNAAQATSSPLGRDTKVLQVRSGLEIALTEMNRDWKSLDISGTLGILGNVYRKLLEIVELDTKSTIYNDPSQWSCVCVCVSVLGEITK